MHEIRRFFEYKSIFLKETHMFSCSARRDERILSNEASFETITRVLKELSSIILKISCSVGEMHDESKFLRD